MVATLVTIDKGRQMGESDGLVAAPPPLKIDLKILVLLFRVFQNRRILDQLEIAIDV